MSDLLWRIKPGEATWKVEDRSCSSCDGQGRILDCNSVRDCEACNGNGLYDGTGKCTVQLVGDVEVDVDASGYNYADPSNPLPDTLFPIYNIMIGDSALFTTWDGDEEAFIIKILSLHRAGTLPHSLYDRDYEIKPGVFGTGEHGTLREEPV